MDDSKSNIYICDFCGEGKFNQAEMKTHILLEHIEHRISCPFCDLCDISEDEMNMHVNAAHIDLLEGASYSLSNKTSIQEVKHVKHIDSRPAVDTDPSLNNSDSLFSDDSPQVAEITNDKSHANKTVISSEPVLNLTQMNTTQQNSQLNCHNDLVGIDIMETEYNCPICPFSTDHADTLMVHVNQAHFQDTPVKNQLPSANFLDSSTNKHAQERLNKENSDSFNVSSMLEQQKQKYDNGKEFECDKEDHPSDTNKAGTSSEMEFTPVKRDPSCINTVQCPYCDLELEAEVSLQFHTNGCHSEEEIIRLDIGDISECPMCGEIFGLGKEEEDNFKSHIENHFIAETEDKTGNDLKIAEELQWNENKENQPKNDSQVSQVLKARQEQAIKYQQHKQFKSKDSPPDKGGYKRNAIKNMEKAVSRGQMSITDFYAKQHDMIHANNAGVDEGSSSTKDIIPKLEQFYHLQRRSNVMHHWLASPMDHYAGSYGDRGWGCGYRNLQMLLSCLLRIPIYQPIVFGAMLKIPSIPKVQQMIEDAWARGFDPQGREQLQKVVNTSKWIGATEIYATLSSLKVKCELVDFYIPTGKDNTHPRLFQWVRDYFRSDRPYKPPLYLQHQGHSRTIIGIEEYKDSSLKLLIFDPSTPKGQMMKFCNGNIDSGLMKTLRRTIYGLKAKQYQIVAVTGVLTECEQQNCKLLKSERIP